MRVRFRTLLQGSKSIFNAWQKNSRIRLSNFKQYPKFRFTGGVAASLATASLLSYKYPNWFSSFRKNLAELRFSQPADKKTSTFERARINKLLDEHFDDVHIMMTNSNGLDQKQREYKTGASFIEDHPNVVEFPWLPGYLIKRDTTRVKGAKVIEDCIRENNLKYVGVAEKWLYKPKSSSFDEPLVVVKKVEHIDKPMNLNQAKDLCFVLRNAQYDGCYYYDFKGGNLAHSPDGRLIFIDTEKSSFTRYPGGEPQVRLAMWTRDEKIGKFIDQQLCEVAPAAWIYYSGHRHINLEILALMRLGYKKDEISKTLKKNLHKPHVATWNQKDLTGYEERIDQTIDLMFNDNASKHEELTQKQQKVIKKIFAKKYFSEKRYYKYCEVLAEGRKTT